MAEVKLEDVPRKARDYYDKGSTSLQRGNMDHAIDMFLAALEIEPAFLKARIALRAAMIRNHEGKGKTFFGGVSGFGSIAKISSLINKKPQEALREAEKLLRSDPTNFKFIKAFDQAAEACGLPEAAAITYEAAKKANAKNPDYFQRLGKLYLDIDQSSKAKEAFEQLVLLKPNDQKALKLLKDAAAIDTMQSGGWEGAGSYRDVMKDEKEAQLLEQESKSHRSSKGLEDLLQEARAKIQIEPQNINYRRALADLLSRDNQFEEAIATLEEANDMTGGADPEIDRAISMTRVRHFDAYIKQLREAGQDQDADEAEAEKQEFLFSDAKGRVQRYPNDLSFKYDLGVLHYKRGEYTEALQQLQQAQRNPQRRIMAIYYTALCFKAKNQLEIAAEQLEKAAEEMVTLDDTKKELLYELGLIYEAMDNMEKARSYFREIYTVDIGYKDVAEKMEKGLGG